MKTPEFVFLSSLCRTLGKSLSGNFKVGIEPIHLPRELQGSIFIKYLRALVKGTAAMVSVNAKTTSRPDSMLRY